MLTAKNTEEVLNKFFNELIKQSRSNLTRQKKNASKDLYNSLDYNVKVNPNSIESDFTMEDYGDFIDKGVKGTKSGRSLADYRYKTKKPPLRFIRTWMKQKSGKFRQRNQTAIAFAIQNKVFTKGLEPTQFYSKPFERLYLRLPQELIEAYGDDLDDFLNFELNDNGK